MTKVTTTEAKQKLDAVIARAARKGECIALTRNGKTVAGIVPAEDLELLRRIREREDAADRRAAKKALKEFREGKTISLENYKKEIGR